MTANHAFESGRAKGRRDAQRERYVSQIMKTKQMAVAVLLLGASVVSMAGELKHSYAPKAGYVPNAETAIKIAEAVWLPIYGDAVLKKKPYKARLVGGVWIVEGTLPIEMVGGVPLAEISRKDGKVLRVSHGQ